MLFDEPLLLPEQASAVAAAAVCCCCFLLLLQYVPESDTSVCGRVLHQTLPPDASSAGGSQAGIWFFDCAKPAGFICESERVLSTIYVHLFDRRQTCVIFNVCPLLQ